MKKKIIFGIAILVNISLAMSQKTDIEWGKSFESKTEVRKIIGTHEGTMFTFSERVKKDYIEGFDDKNFTQKFSSEFSLEKKHYLLDIINSNNGPIALTYTLNKKEKTVYIFASQFNSAGELKNERTTIMKAVDDIKVKNQQVLIDYSNDKSKILISYQRQDKKDENILNSDFVVINNSAEVLSKKTFKEDLNSFAEGKDVYFNFSIDVSNKGGYVFSISKFAERKKQASKYSLSVYEFDKNGKELESINIVPEGKGVYSPKIHFDEESGQIKIVGFYFKNTKKNQLYSSIGYSGVYNVTLERGTLKKINSNTTPFSDDFLGRFYSENKINRANDKDKELTIPYTFDIDNIFINEKGDYVITAENYQYSVVRDQRNGTTTRTWLFGDVIVMSINDKGKLKWINTVKKTQMASKTNANLGFGTAIGFLTLTYSVEIGKKYPAEYSNYSYIAGLGENELILLYNDHYKLADNDQDDRKALTNPKKSIPYQYTFNYETGEGVKKTLISESDKQGTYLAPNVYYKLANNKYIVWARFKDENKFSLVTFK